MTTIETAPLPVNVPTEIDAVMVNPFELQGQELFDHIATQGLGFGVGRVERIADANCVTTILGNLGTLSKRVDVVLSGDPNDKQGIMVRFEIASED
ncbi:MAG TPA: hypothetical protein VLF87_00085 [Patescibacteria group bacterium]|nr:hypothetical protein [Patescibacteria group bacterium]